MYKYTSPTSRTRSETKGREGGVFALVLEQERNIVMNWERIAFGNVRYGGFIIVHFKIE